MYLQACVTRFRVEIVASHDDRPHALLMRDVGERILHQKHDVSLASQIEAANRAVVQVAAGVERCRPASSCDNPASTSCALAYSRHMRLSSGPRF